MKTKFLFITIILFVLIFGAACDNGEKNNIQNYSGGFKENFSTIKKNNGWYYYFVISTDAKTGDKSYFFDGCNLKERDLDGFYIYVRNSETNEIINKIKSFPTLSTSEEYRDEIVTINDFFKDSKFE